MTVLYGDRPNFCRLTFSWMITQLNLQALNVPGKKQAQSSCLTTADD